MRMKIIYPILCVFLARTGDVGFKREARDVILILILILNRWHSNPA